MAPDLEQGLPPLLDRWVRELVGEPLPAEQRATCQTCPMLEPKSVVAFNAGTKCCTYFPVLPNFSVGAILADPDPSMAFGRQALQDRIAEGEAVTPFGVGRFRSYARLYEPKTMFGRSGALRCPYYVAESGGCGVWRHREAVCATWFCKHERGFAGHNLWRAVQSLLESIQSSLARSMALELGVNEDALDALVAGQDADPAAGQASSYDLDRRENPSFYAGIWGSWADREAAYFTACAERVAALDRAELERRCGAKLTPRIRDVKAALAAPPAGFPTYLVKIKMARPLAEDRERDTVQMAAYSRYDPLELETRVATAIEAFDGRPTQVVLDELRARGVRLDDALLRRLIDFGILEGTPV